MPGWWAELRQVRNWALVIETVSSVIIVLYCVAAFVSVVRRRDRGRAQQLVGEGALAGLSLMLCATLLRTLLLTSWQQIGMFASILALRSTLKRVLGAEKPT